MKNYFIQLVRNNPLLLVVILLFLLLSLGNKVYNNYTASSQNYKRFIHSFPAYSKEEKLKFQQEVIKKCKNLKDVILYIHIVKLGENYWQENGIDIDTIIGLNPYLKNLYAGLNERIIVANRKGCLHIVEGNETLIDISNLYNVSVNKIRKVNRINILTEYLYGLKKGDILFIPDAKPVILTKQMKYWYDLRNALQSPLGGAYTSGYGVRIDPFTKKKKFHNGLDIRVSIGTPVGAAADGIVIAAGWAGGYGKMIKIKHYNGYTTLYGHLSRIYVRVGQRVRRGQIIGRSGNTGRTTGPHLHFTVWYKGKSVNPALFLW